MSNSYLLLVEDNPGDARLTMVLLEGSEKLGLPPLRWVQSVHEAADLLAAEPGCVAVLLDLGLPDSEGLGGLHALNEVTLRIPIIILTGSDSQPMGLDAMSSGAQDFMVKGQFDAESLQRAITFASQRTRAEAALVDRALKDELTGLPRRTLLLDRIQSATRQARRERTTGALLFIDLDGFKAVNDTYGHAAGDEVLRIVARRLQENMRASDTVARLGGDEFVVLLPVVTHTNDAAVVAAKVLASIELPVAFHSQSLNVSASIGVVPVTSLSGEATDLLARADEAMYQAKQQGRRRVVALDEVAPGT